MRFIVKIKTKSVMQNFFFFVMKLYFLLFSCFFNSIILYAYLPYVANTKQVNKWNVFGRADRRTVKLSYSKMY